jgi:hypothetical protein
MPTIQVPGVGNVERKYVIGGGITVAAVAGYFWIRRNRTPLGASPADPTVDPLTGLPYTTENQPQTGFVNPNPVQSTIDLTGDQITTNAQWAAVVTDKLGNLGFDGNYLASVLGKYLGGQGLTLEEAATIRAAWAYVGKPPQGPDTIKLTTDGSTPGATTTTKTVHILAGWSLEQWVKDLQAGNEGPIAAQTSWADIVRLNGGPSGALNLSTKWVPNPPRHIFTKSMTVVVGH